MVPNLSAAKLHPHRPATGLSLFPVFTPMLMLLRKASPVGIPAWQPWFGLLGVMLATVLIVWMGGRIFRIAILMQGGPPKLSKIIRWAIDPLLLIFAPRRSRLDTPDEPRRPAETLVH